MGPPAGECARLERVGRTRLEPVVRQALGCDTAQLRDWTWTPLSYHGVLRGRTLARFTGRAVVAGDRDVSWSSVVKVLGGSREVLAYRSALLAELPGCFRAPRVLQIEDAEEGADWLWLEDMTDLYARCWPLQQFGVVARHLGAFNGTDLVSRALPTDPWLNPWLDRQRVGAERAASSLPELRLVTGRPAVRRLFGPAITARAARLLEDQSLLVDALSKLPQTLCHHEASLANLFARRRADGELETVAVDWEEVGPGPVGAEIATLVFGTMRRCEFDAVRAGELERVVFAEYVAGLREVGWEGDVQTVRLGYAGAVALRWAFLVSALRELAEGTPQPQSPSDGHVVTPDTAVRQWMLLANFVLDRADEARGLIRHHRAGRARF